MVSADYAVLIELIKTYLIQVTKQPSIVDIFISHWIPIIQLLIVFFGAIAGLYKYYSTKNKEINEKMLSEVYAPLYQYFVKQELYCFITGFKRDIRETPIIELTSKKSKQTISIGGENHGKIKNETTTQVVLGLNRQEFLKVFESINIGLASKELYTLLNMYKVLIHFEGMGDKTPEAFINATIMKVDVENALRAEIIKGYEHYHKKLKLDKITSSNFFKIKDNNIEFNYVVDQKTKEDLINDIGKNPEKYQ
ncbi:MAG: hypothetical protein PHG06_20000 [Parabacteroides sp.]|nr:hypothetical protein [Parabacteroides sp.]